MQRMFVERACPSRFVGLSSSVSPTLDYLLLALLQRTLANSIRWVDQSFRSATMESISHVFSNFEHQVASDISQLINFAYEVIQRFIVWLYSPPTGENIPAAKRHVRIAVIGAGLTGISAAAHCRGHGADVWMFEGRSVDNLGGIWSRVNSMSSLQV